MARDNIVFKFRIDLTQMTVKGREAIKILDEIQRKSGQAAQGMTQLGTASAKTGQQTAASAVNFQTATQGMLNLSTAAVQTYTSISNLDRANNRAKMSTIAVARAEDLLANKIERQNTLRASGLAGSQKDINITREIATAKADLAVKIEKEGIEQAAVNDIYMLFATNVANVTISSMQTLAILDKNQILLSKGKVIAQKLLTFATWDGVRANIAARTSMTGLAVGLGATKIGFSLSTVAVRLHTFALHALKIALGPIGLIFIGISAAMVAYETNLGGIKDTINGLLGVEDDHLKLMDQEREAALELTAANEGLASSYKKLSTPMENYLKLQEVAAAQSGDLAAQIRITQQRLGFSSPSVRGGLPTSAGGIAQQGSGPSYSGGSVSSTLPAAIAPSGERTSKVGQSNVNPSVSTGVSTSSTGAAGQPFIADPFGSFQEKANFGALNVRDQALELIKLTDQALTNGDEFKAQSYGKWLGAISDDATNFTKAKEGKHITFADIQKESSGLKSIREVSDDPFSPENLIARSSPFIAKGVGKFKLGTDYSKIGTRTFYAGFGGEMIARIGERYGAGMDSNLVAELSRLQAEGLDFTKTNTNLKRQTQFDFDYMNKYGGVNGGLNVSSGGGYTQSAIAAGVSATASYQNRTVRASADFYARNRMRDSNTNRLNLMGATRVEGIPMDEEGAVVGGYSSRREYSRQMKNLSMIRDNANRQLGAFFGVGINYSAIYGKSSARSQQSQLNSRVDSIRSALASAGLSYKTTSARYRRGQGPAQYAAVMAEWASVRSFNASQLSKAAEINTLQQGFGLTGFSGSTMSLPSLQDEVAKQDEMIKTIGLNRTEAFQIIDTAGRGRDEIDARVLWKNRVNNISTGTSVL
jgi:hypothetical protein